MHINVTLELKASRFDQEESLYFEGLKLISLV